MRKSVLLATALSVALFDSLHPVNAEEPQAPPVVTLPELVVTANRVPTPGEQVASSVTVITAEELEQRQIHTVSDAIRAAPGLYLAQNGGAGKQARVFLRGAESRHTLVLLDGIEIQDPSSPDGAFDFQHLDSDDVERIEILRGPQSSLYGSDAIGGVINIITKKGNGPLKTSFSGEAGSFATHAERASLSGSTGPFHYRLNVSYFDTDGISVTPKRLRPAGANREPDGYENFTVSSRLGWDIGEIADIGVSFRYVNTASQIDTKPEDPNSIEHTDQFFGRIHGGVSLFDGLLDSKLGFGYTLYDRRDDDRADKIASDFSHALNRSTKDKVDWQNDLHLLNLRLVKYTLTAGAETERETGISNAQYSSGFISTFRGETRNNAGYLSDQWGFFDRFYLSSSVRYDSHSTFGDATTYRFAPSYLLRETDTKFKGSYGTGFRAPTLAQLHGAGDFLGFSVYHGNPALRPERSEGFDAGFEQALWKKRINFGATYFRSQIRNLIFFTTDPVTFDSTYTNIASTTTKGVEAFVAVALLDNLDLRLDYTYTDAINDATRRQLQRRPHNKGSLTVDWQPTEKTTLSLTGLYVGPRTDVDAVTFLDKKTDSYVVFNLAGSYAVTENWKVYTRLENMFNQRYEDPDGFLRPGIAAYGGFKVVF